jgi:serine/threonine protein kinase
MIDFKYCPKCNKILIKGTKCNLCSSTLELKEPDFFVGKSFGKYKIEGVLGYGGMGIVYLARHSILNRLSALKMIIPSLEQESTFLERFLREAQLLATLKHPNIVGIYDFDISDYGSAYYAMEFVEGISLRDLLLRHSKIFNVDDFSTIFKEIASALDYAHSKNVIHRDLKPENILLTISENRVSPKILDFGIAKVLSEDSSKTLTGEGNIIGTINYIAPEQLLSKQVSPRTDQYAFALIVAEIISKKSLREGKTLGEIVAKDINFPVGRTSLPEDTPENIISAIQKATATQPEDRFESVSKFVEELKLKEPLNLDTMKNIILRETSGYSPTISTPSGSEVISQLSRESKKTKETVKSEKLKKSNFKKFFVPAAVVLILGLLLTSIFFLSKKKKEIQENQSTPFEKTGEWEAPADSIEILSSNDEKAMLIRGSSSLYMMKVDSKIPTPIQLKSGEELIGASSINNPILFDGKRIYEKSLDSGNEIPIFDSKGMAVEKAIISKSNRTLALIRKDEIFFYSLINKSEKPITTIKEEGIEKAFYYLSDKYFSATKGLEVVSYEVETGKQVYQKQFSERVNGIMTDDSLNILSICGWFDRILLYDFLKQETKEIAISGETKNVLIFSEAKLLASVGNYGLKIFDLDDRSLLYQSKENIPFDSISFSPDGILSLSKKNSSIVRYSLKTLSPSKVVQVCDSDIWCLAEDKKNNLVFAGGSDGKIYSIDEKGEVKSKELHTLGVTSMVATENNLITSSDDKTIALFSLPSLELQFRSTAHDFLINYLQISKREDKLWSSSSDGKLKLWGLPNLKEEMTISASDLLNKKLSLHGFWVDENENRFLIGSWNNTLIYLKKEGNRFNTKIFEIPSQAGMSFAYLPSREAAVIMGSYNIFSLYLFDLKNEELFLLSQITINPLSFSISKSPENNVCYFATGGEVTKIEIKRENEGKLSYSYKTLLFPHPSIPSSVLNSKDGKTIILGTSMGEVIFLNNDSFNSSKEIKGENLKRIYPSKPS